MSTKAAEAPRALTDQTRATVFDGVRAATGSLTRMGTFGGCPTEWATSLAASKPALYQVSEKALEASRQIARVKSIASVCNGDDPSDDACLESIGTSVALIGSLLSGPLPIPVASSGESGATTLFFDGADFYGDIEIRGKLIDYYIKGKTKGFDVEVFDSEEVKGGVFPPKLLMHLYAHYAR